MAEAEASEARLTARPSVQLPVCRDYLSYLFALEFLVREKGASDNANAFPDIWLMDGRYVTFQLAEVAVPRELFRKILNLIEDLRRRPVPA